MGIFERVAAVVIERGAPKHGAVIHHAVLDVIDGLRVAESARPMRDAEIAGIDELDEFLGFLIQQDAGVARVRGTLPENFVARCDMRFLLREARSGIAAVAIDAAEHDVRGLVHFLDAAVAFETAPAFGVRLRESLIDAIAWRTGGFGIWNLSRNGKRRTECGVKL